MKTLLIAWAALAGPAFAQAPATPMPYPAPVAPPSEQARAAIPSGAIADAVRAEWGKYDRDNKGMLTPLEFGAWVMAANGRDAEGMPPAQVLNATSGFFNKADVNRDHLITPEELTVFLQQ